jgi:hypothetical protein
MILALCICGNNLCGDNGNYSCSILLYFNLNLSNSFACMACIFHLDIGGKFAFDILILNMNAGNWSRGHALG